MTTPAMLRTVRPDVRTRARPDKAREAPDQAWSRPPDRALRPAPGSEIDILCCPSCRGELGRTACRNCGRPYARVGSQLRFVDAPVETVDAAFQAATHNNSNLVGWLFNAGKAVLSSEYQPTDHLREFLGSAVGVVVELGSGARRLRPDVLTVDLFPNPNVDLVADISETPIRDGKVDFVILDSVIEHVEDPVAAVREARRILKRGGRLFINCPFMLPYHGYPAHYQNFTRDGLEHLLRDFSSCTVKPTFGPMSAWVNMTAETFAVMLAGERGLAYVVAKGCALLPIFWLKYLDIFFARTQRAHRLAGMLCAQAVK